MVLLKSDTGIHSPEYRYPFDRIVVLERSDCGVFKIGNLVPEHRNLHFEIWLVSAISAIPFFLLFRDRVPTDLFVKSFFPNLFANNWYLTCYLLFYPIHPLLNKIIKQLDKRSLFYLAFSMVIAYFIGSFVFHNVLFSTYLIVWITIYFIISYIKLYLPNYTNNIKLNLYGLVMGVIGCIVIAILTNKSLMCFRAITENQGVLYWAVINNPFLLIISLSLFNIFNKYNYHNKLINYLSSYSLLIYIIHENIFIRRLVRPKLFEIFFLNVNGLMVIADLLLLSLIIFVISLIAGIVFKYIFNKLILNVVIKVVPMIKNIYKIVMVMLDKLNKAPRDTSNS